MTCVLGIIALALIGAVATEVRERRRDSERRAAARCEWCGRKAPTKFSNGYGMEDEP